MPPRLRIGRYLFSSGNSAAEPDMTEKNNEGNGYLKLIN
jgi:hypothetical protein